MSFSYTSIMGGCVWVQNEIVTGPVAADADGAVVAALGAPDGAPLGVAPEQPARVPVIATAATRTASLLPVLMCFTCLREHDPAELLAAGSQRISGMGERDVNRGPPPPVDDGADAGQRNSTVRWY